MSKALKETKSIYAPDFLAGQLAAKLNMSKQQISFMLSLSNNLITTSDTPQYLTFRDVVKSLNPPEYEAPISHPVVVIGNDPVIEGLEKFSQKVSDNKPIVLVGLSGLRSLEVDLRLSNRKVIPLIFIIDQSPEVIEFWKNFIAFVNKNPDESTFFKELPSFFAKNAKLMHGGSLGLESSQLYITEIIRGFGYEFVRKTVSSMILLNRTWQDRGLFELLKQLFKLFDIDDHVYLYASNIVSYYHLQPKFSPSELDQDFWNAEANMIKNIETLNPVVSIHSNFRRSIGACTGFPEKIFFCNNHALFSEVVKELQKELEPGINDHTVVSLLDNLKGLKNLASHSKINESKASHLVKVGAEANVLNRNVFVASLNNYKQMSLKAVELLKAGKNEEAITYLIPLSSYFRSNPAAIKDLKMTLYNLGNALFKTGKYQEARIHFKELIDFDKENPKYKQALDKCDELERQQPAESIALIK